MKTVGDCVPDALPTFDAMKKKYSLSPVLMDNLVKSGYTMPTPIQTQAIPIMLEVCEDILMKYFMYLLISPFDRKGKYSLVPQPVLVKQLHSWCQLYII